MRAAYKVLMDNSTHKDLPLSNSTYRDPQVVTQCTKIYRGQFSIQWPVEKQFNIQASVDSEK